MARRGGWSEKKELYRSQQSMLLNRKATGMGLSSTQPHSKRAHACIHARIVQACNSRTAAATQPHAQSTARQSSTIREGGTHLPISSFSPLSAASAEPRTIGMSSPGYLQGTQTRRVLVSA